MSNLTWALQTYLPPSPTPYASKVTCDVSLHVAVQRCTADIWSRAPYIFLLKKRNGMGPGTHIHTFKTNTSKCWGLTQLNLCTEIQTYLWATAKVRTRSYLCAAPLTARYRNIIGESLGMVGMLVT